MKEGGLKCTDKEQLDKQKGVLMEIIKQVAKNLFKKEGLIRMSLPVRIFEGRSTLERITDNWRFAPVFLEKAARLSDRLERFKLVVTYAVSGMYCSAHQLKPFNPILGETFEGNFPDGTKIFIEHTSHHPPVSNFYVESRNYRITGFYEFIVKMGANNVKGHQCGPNVIRFNDGQTIVFNYPRIKLGGTVAGDRTANYVGEMFFEDKDLRCKCALFFDFGKKKGIMGSRKKGTKRDQFKGLLYYNTPGVVIPKKILKLKDVKDIDREIAPVEGSWLENLKIGSMEYWNIDRYEPVNVGYSKNPLPSDWRYREDLLWLRKKNIPFADAWKVKLEVQQRKDRAGRQKFEKEQKKLAKKTRP